MLGDDEHVMGEVGRVAVLLAPGLALDPLQDLFERIADKQVAEAFEL